MLTRGKYATYGLAIVAGVGVGLWAGLPAYLLLFLVACPLLMFFMMRGMHRGGDDEGGHGGHGSRPAPPSQLDGSHERMERP